MAAYRDRYPEFRTAKAEVVGISVDSPEKSKDLSKSLKLPFPLLSDPNKELLTAWRTLNRDARGGIAFPSTWVVDSARIVRHRVLERKAARVDPGPTLGFLNGTLSASQASELRTIGLNVQGTKRWVSDLVGGALKRRK